MARVRLASKVNTIPLGWMSDDELRVVLDKCLVGRQQRIEQYNSYRQLVYSNEDRNLLYRYLKELVSLLYVSDNIIFDILIDESDSGDVSVLRDDISRLKQKVEDDFSTKSIDVNIYRWVFNGLLYGSFFVKCILDGKDISFKGVFPYDISVMYEDISDIDNTSQVIVHTVRIPKRVALKKYSSVSFPEASYPYKDVGKFLDIVSKGADGTVTGVLGYSRDNVTLTPKNVGEYVELHEAWIWDDEVDDYVMVQFIGNQVYRYKNPFLPKMHPFIRLCINSMEEYFWGISELHFITNIQQKITMQENLLKYLQDMLLNPVMVIYGISGSVEAKEIQNKLSKPGEVVEIIDPTSKIEFYLPKLNPEFVHSLLKYYEDIFNQQTSLTSMLAGRGMPTVRSAKHAQLIAQFASAGLRDKALIVEYFIEKLMTLYANCLCVTDKRFSMLNTIDFKVDVFAHTSSPIIAMSYQDMLFQLSALGVVPIDTLIEILPLPKKHEILQRVKNVKTTTAQEEK